MPKISVIIPIFNAEDYLAQCLESVVMQTMQDIEILCIDDRSSDRSVDIVNAFSAGDERIQLIENGRNLGVSSSRNEGIRCARAPYIAGVDSDDHIHPQMMQRLWEATDLNSVDIVECGFALVEPDGYITSIYSPEDADLDNSNDEVDVFNVVKNAFWNKLWRRDLFFDNDVFFPDGMRREDMATTPRLLSCAQRVRTIPDVLYNYLNRASSATNSMSASHIVDYFRCFELLADFFLKRGLLDHYYDNLVSFLESNMHYHAETVLDFDIPEAEKQQYIRMMVLFKRGYFADFPQLQGQQSRQLLELLLSATP